MSGTNIQYGNVTLTNVLVNGFEDTPRRDVGSNRLFDRFLLTASGLCVGQPGGPVILGASINGTMGSNGVQTYKKIVAQLADRQRCIFQCNGEIVFDVKPEDDADNGPKVLKFSVVHIAGTTFRVQLVIEVCRTICGESSLTAGGIANNAYILSNVWSLTSDYDDTWAETREVRGQVRMAKNFAVAGATLDVLTPNSFRGLIAPPLQRGFARSGMHFGVTPDGLTLEYSFRDVQVFASAPPPATRWTATHTETTGQFAVETFSGIHVVLTGPPQVQKKHLVGTAVQIAFAKLDLQAGTFDSAKTKLINSTLTDHLESPTIELQLIVQRYQTDPAKTFFSNTLKGFGNRVQLSSIGYDPDVSMVPPVWGLDGITGAFSAYLQTTCNVTHGYPTNSPPTEQSTPAPAPGSKNPVPFTTTVIEAPTYSLQTSVEQGEHIYSSYRLDSTYETIANQAACPIARSLKATGPTVAMVTLAPPSQRRVIRFEAKRHGDWPKVPLPQSQYQETPSIVAQIVKNSLLAVAPELGVDGGTYDFTCRGEMIYQLSEPVPREFPLRTGALPWSVATIAQTQFSQEYNYSTEII